MFYKVIGDKKFRYYEKFYDHKLGVWRQVSCTLTSKTRAAQAEARRILEAKIEKKLNTVFGVPQDLTVSEVMSEWLVLREKSLKRNTFVRQKATVDQAMRVFGSQKLEKLTVGTLQKFFLNDNWSASYRRLVVVIMKQFFDYAFRVGYLSENPMDRVVLPKEKEDPLKKEYRMNKFLDQKEMSAYLSFLRENKSDERFILFCEFLYLTGLRIGEALGLTWSNVDTEEKTIFIQHTLVTEGGASNYYLTSPKTSGSVRTVHVSDRVMEIMQRYSELEDSVDDLIFIYNGQYPIYITTFNSFLRRTFEQSGIQKGDGFRLTSHVFRHSHISLLAELGMPLKVIMDRVGHVNEKTTISVYTHVTKTMNQELLDKLQEVNLDSP